MATHVDAAIPADTPTAVTADQTAEVDESDSDDTDASVQLNEEVDDLFDDERSFWDLAESTKDANAELSEDNFGFGNEAPQEFDPMEGATVGDDGQRISSLNRIVKSPTKKMSTTLTMMRQSHLAWHESLPSLSSPSSFRQQSFIFTKDRVTPKQFSKRVLNDKWAETTVRSLPPIANSVPLMRLDHSKSR